MKNSSVAILVGVLLTILSTPVRADDEPPLNCEAPSATFEINACADKDFAAADGELNLAYKAALAAIPGLSSEPPYDTKPWEAALRKSQRAWVAFRDAECRDHAAMFWSGGSGATAEILGCMTEKTKARAKELTDLYAR